MIDGVVYWLYPEEGYAEIHSTVRGSLPQVLEIPQYVNGYPVTRLDTFGLADLEGVVGVILPDTMTFIDDISIAGFDLVFVSLPNNEVNIEKNFVGAHALDYYYLPQNFSLSPECSAYGSKLFASHTCVGYEKHRAFASDLIPMDAHPDSQYVPANSGVFRVDGNELTAIYLVSLRDPSFNGNLFCDGLCGQLECRSPRWKAPCKNYNTSLVLGDYVRVVEDGAFTESGAKSSTTFTRPHALSGFLQIFLFDPALPPSTARPVLMPSSTQRRTGWNSSTWQRRPSSTFRKTNGTSHMSMMSTGSA